MALIDYLQMNTNTLDKDKHLKLWTFKYIWVWNGEQHIMFTGFINNLERLMIKIVKIIIKVVLLI